MSQSIVQFQFCLRQNMFTAKMVRSFLLISKIIGLLPFQLSARLINRHYFIVNASISSKSTAYSICVTIIFTIFLTKETFLSKPNYPDTITKPIGKFVYILEEKIIILKFLIIMIWQIVNKNQLIYLYQTLSMIWYDYVIKLSSIAVVPFLNANQRKLYRFQMLLIIFQLFFILLIITLPIIQLGLNLSTILKICNILLKLLP